MAHEPVAVLERVVTIMNLVTSEDADIGIREIARRTGIHSATVHRLVTTLQAAGLLQQNPATALYRTGPLAFTWGSGFLRRADLRQAAMPCMRRLRDRFDETVALSLQTGAHRVYMEQLPSNRGVRTIIQVGSPYDLFAGAAGIALLSAMSEQDFEGLTAEAALPAERIAAIREAIAETRERGYALSQQHVLTGVTAVSSPVVDAVGGVWAVSVLGPSARMDAMLEEIAAALVEATHEIALQAAGER